MMEYTITALVVLAIVLALDHFLLQTRIITLSNKRLWKTTAVFVLFQFVFDNYFTWKGLWVFDRTQVIGIFLPFIPIENLLFGMELLWLTLIFYVFARKALR